MHDDTSRTAVLSAKNEMEYLYHVFEKLLAENKTVKVYGKKGKIISIKELLPFPQYRKLLQEQIPTVVILEAKNVTNIKDKIITELMVAANVGSQKLIVNYRGNLSQKELVEQVKKYGKEAPGK